MTSTVLEATDRLALDGTEAQREIEAGSGSDAAFRRPRPTITESHVKRAAELLGQVWRGSRTALRTVEEVFTTNDFQTAAWVVIDRATIATYTALTPTWQDWIFQTTVRDFRPKKLIDLTQSNMALLKVEELAPYKEAERAGGKSYEISVGKYGRLYGFSWEAWINDQLGELQDIPTALALAASDLDAKNAISLLTKGNGPDGNYFKSANGNAPTAVPLTMNNLDAALSALRSRIPTDKDRPVIVPKWNLVVPLALQTQAERILSTVEVRDTDATTGQSVTHTNYVAGSVDLKVEPWLQVIDKGSKAASTWYLVPSKDSTVKPFAFARLQGHETPDLRVKSDTGQRFGGGDIPANEGNFDNDSVAYRVRHVNGVAQLDPTYTYVSTGS